MKPIRITVGSCRSGHHTHLRQSRGEVTIETDNTHVHVLLDADGLGTISIKRGPVASQRPESWIRFDGEGDSGLAPLKLQSSFRE